MCNVIAHDDNPLFKATNAKAHSKAELVKIGFKSVSWSH